MGPLPLDQNSIRYFPNTKSFSGTALGELQWVVPIFDGFLISGVLKTKVEAVENHEKRLAALSERFRNKGIKLNEKKYNFCLWEVLFMGHVICDEGLKPDPAKIQLVQEILTQESRRKGREAPWYGELLCS